MDLTTIAEAGGWVTAIGIALLMLEGFRREWWVPGHVYRREVERGDKAVAAATSVAKATEKVVRSSTRDQYRDVDERLRRRRSDESP